ncbi:hypothetical protein [Enterobacter cloacae]|uniref:hypothetical protein n=1 Tax=Enterobacter cloacae TaxID=550 RepID=UPI0013EF64A6|nr:hypothetical protein [Enterobacter cloacae]
MLGIVEVVMNTRRYFKHSEFDALSNGFVEIPNESTEGDRPLFVKDGKKWIYTIIGLKKDLGVNTDEQLISLGYDVETYWQLENKARENLKPLSDLHAEIRPSDSDDGPVHLEGDSWLYPDGSIHSR